LSGLKKELEDSYEILDPELKDFLVAAQARFTTCGEYQNLQYPIISPLGQFHKKKQKI
jgi:hypothetical protein